MIVSGFFFFFYKEKDHSEKVLITLSLRITSIWRAMWSKPLDPIMHRGTPPQREGVELSDTGERCVETRTQDVWGSRVRHQNFFQRVLYALRTLLRSYIPSRTFSPKAATVTECFTFIVWRCYNQFFRESDRFTNLWMCDLVKLCLSEMCQKLPLEYQVKPLVFRQPWFSARWIVFTRSEEALSCYLFSPPGLEEHLKISFTLFFFPLQSSWCCCFLLKVFSIIITCQM